MQTSQSANQNESTYQQQDEAVAVIGFSGRFPQAANVEEYWQNLCQGVECLSTFSDEECLANGVDPELLTNPNFRKVHGVLENPEWFDAHFFDVTPREARILDPQHRIFLEGAWEAFEHAGYASENYDGRVGVYGGTSFSTYLLRNILPNNLVRFQTIDRLEMALTNHKDTMPMRASFHMNLTGPSLSVGTTCSTSIVAVHLACQSLLNYESDMSLAGASFHRTPAKEGYLFQEGMIYSPDGHIRTFDADSKGIVTGAGMGVVVLKRLSEALEDRDTIYSVIKASALNNDGSTKIGYTAPSSEGQAISIAEAMKIAGFKAESVGYVEAHGTGTELGDPIELEALQKAFRYTSDDPDNLASHECMVGSAKPNIGHLNHAAGMAGLIKAVKALHHKKLPPNINFSKPNPKIDWENSPFYVNTELKDWEHDKETPRRAGVSAFGIGGTNGHISMEEAPEQEATSSTRRWQLLPMSCKTATALEMATQNLLQHCQQNPTQDLGDIANTLQVGRTSFNCRRFAVCDSEANPVDVLSDPSQLHSGMVGHERRSPAFMFSGQGSQYPDMGKALYETEPAFKEIIDHCDTVLKECADIDLLGLLYGGETLSAEDRSGRLEQTANAQPALFAVEYAIARMLIEWGVEPAAMIGHSIGEYVAACVAGVLSLEDALFLVAKRGQLMQSVPTGSMLAVSLSEADAKPWIESDESLCIAVVNAPEMTVIAGPDNSIDKLIAALDEKAVASTRLHTSHAFHSSMMQPIVESFSELVSGITLNAPDMPYVSNVSGDWITEEQATSPEYWATHLRHAVKFSDGINTLLEKENYQLIEIGPGRALATFAIQHDLDEQSIAPLTTLPGAKQANETASDEFLLNTIGKLWVQGISIHWPSYQSDQSSYHIALPTYPFEREFYWIAGPKPGEGYGNQPQGTLSMLAGVDSGIDEQVAMALEVKREAREQAQEAFQGHGRIAPRDIKEETIATVWKQALGIEDVGIHDNYFELGGSSLLASQIAAKLSDLFDAEVSIDAIVSAPTIEQLALRIEVDNSQIKVEAPKNTNAAETKTSQHERNILIKLRGDNGAEESTPLFLFPAIDGQAMIYNDLSSSLDGDFAIYAFQAPGLNGGENIPDSIEATARYYLEIVQRKQSHGPYRLGGSSFGGAVAYEVSQQLVAQGEVVELLFMMDTPLAGKGVSGWTTQANVLAFIAKNTLRLNDDSLTAEALAGLDETESLSRVVEAYGSKALSAEQLGHWVSVFQRNNQSLKSYQPKPYIGEMLYFKAEQVWDEEQQAFAWWASQAKGGCELLEVAGTHLSINFKPDVAAVVKRIQRSIDRLS